MIFKNIKNINKIIKSKGLILRYKNIKISRKYILPSKDASWQFD